ncbi:insoluble matrix shell protein 4-like [Pogonomyrmex barbatus]|uniref:Insoluble matrix shell protein 4-like n=1 Tax=Pogonomyrmex barbatus TaxID=144034 RepID=A0A6I9WMK3_9HYME|nr:insoluble matrix shell protein 4-like [Pogonomyrmex barbatus]
MLLSTVIICCVIVANAEPPLNGYSLISDSNGYSNDYGNTVINNGYLGSKDNYGGIQNGGNNYYSAGDISQNPSVSSHLINVGNQDATGGGDVGNGYNGYSANDHGNEYSNIYAGYANTYVENSASESYNVPTRATSVPLRGYTGVNSNREPTFNVYSSDSAHKDSDFGQYAASSSSSSSSSSSKRIPAYPTYPRPTRLLDNYPEGSANSDVQGHHGSSGASSYSQDELYAPYSSGGRLTNEYSFGKQKNDPLDLKGGSKYSGVYSPPFDTRYTRGNVGHVSHNRDLSSYLSGGPGPGGHFSKAHGSIYFSGKPSKYSHKYLSRYAPNNGVAYSPRERDYYMPYGKGSGKVFGIKDNSPSYTGRVYPDEPPFVGGYRSKNGGFVNGYSTSPNFDGYSGSSSYDGGPPVPRRYRTSGPIFVQKSIYP